MATRTRTACDAKLLEDVTLSIDQQVGEFGVTFGGENLLGKERDGWLTIGRYQPHDGSPAQGVVRPFELDHGMVNCGVMTTDNLRELALALTRTADRYDRIRESVAHEAQSDITAIETRRRRRA